MRRLPSCCNSKRAFDALQEDGLPSLHVISLTQREDETDAAVLEDPLLVDRPGLQILQVGIFN